MDSRKTDAEPWRAPGSHPGQQSDLNKDVYTPGTRGDLGLGVAYDLTGKGLMAVKAYYGRYFEGAAGGFYESAVPGVEDYDSILPSLQRQLGTSLSSSRASCMA